jgi:trimeric autotransporter adhesin
MNLLMPLKRAVPLVSITLAFACFGILPPAHAVVPPPDGGYPGGNTAEGQAALLSLNGGSFNTAVGFLSLRNDIMGSYNTAIGAGTLLFNVGNQNTSDGTQNTAIGMAALLSNSTGRFNTGTGALALFSNTTGIANTANGASALFSNTEGISNTATGFEALFSNTTGSFNTGDGIGALYTNTGGDSNTAVGVEALYDNTMGSDNTATGITALMSNTTGSHNTANGAEALLFNTVGSENTAVGFDALFSNGTGITNTATGASALAHNTTGSANTAGGDNALFFNSSGDQNTGLGVSALANNVAGSRNTAVGAFALTQATSNLNTALGFNAGLSVTTASNVICIGASVAGANVSDSCFIGNIYQKQVGADSLPVRVDSFGKLGTEISSRRFKHDIAPMDQVSEVILALRPVTFRYNSDSENKPQFGLIAEEVADVNAALVVYDKDGKPYSVRYDQVNAMLLNEFLKEHRTVENQESRIQQQAATIARQQKQIDALTAGLQRVSDQLALSKSAPRAVISNQ